MKSPEHYYSSSDICKIIKECNKSGVSKLLLHDIEINFTGLSSPDQRVDIPPSVENPPLQMSDEEEKSDERRQQIQDVVSEEINMTLHILDPERWEETELKEIAENAAKGNDGI